MTRVMLRMTKVINPLHGLGNHSYAGAVDQGFVGLSRGQGDYGILGKAGR